MTTRFGNGGTLLSGGLNARVNSPQVIGVSFRGLSDLSFGPVLAREVCSAIFAGAGGFSAAAINAKFFINATFDGVGHLSANVIGISLIGVRFNGASSLRIDAYQNRQQIAARFNAVGGLSVNTRGRLSIRARFSATDVLYANLMQPSHVVNRGDGPGEFNDDFNDDFAIGINRWPTSLPQCPLLDGFAEQKQSNVVAFKPEVGTTKFRRRASNSQWIVSMAFKFNATQLDTFQHFRLVTCMDGAYGFQMLHPVTRVNYWWNWNKKEAPIVKRITPKMFLVNFDLVNLKEVA